MSSLTAFLAKPSGPAIGLALALATAAGFAIQHFRVGQYTPSVQLGVVCLLHGEIAAIDPARAKRFETLAKTSPAIVPWVRQAMAKKRKACA